uniref:Bacterial surface antigen (D15) domain-containing protein n=1 Tax=Acrobeloides nanus TaxID=290746 RepID=A0A914CZ70_9BILA
MVWRSFMPQHDAPFPVREHAGHTTKFSLENSVYIDTRDRPILASRGAFFKVSQEYAGLLGDSVFLKHQLDLQIAAPLILDTILSASLQCAVVKSLADRSLHLLDRLYLGGPHDIRGFDMRSIGTRAETSCIGGAASCAGAIHLYKPLYPRDMVFAHLFTSAGSVSSVRSKHRLRDIMESPRVSAGLGIAVNFKDIIRLELNYVIPLRFAAGDACASGLQFGAGLNFI